MVMETTMMIASAQYEVAEIELVYKTKVKASARPKITSSKDSYDVLLNNWDDNKIDFIEQFKILLLNRTHKVLAVYEVSTGGVAGTVADPKVIFADALKANASFLILAHNHPSSSLKTSQADEMLSHKINEAGKFLDIKVLDHVIVTREGYYSFADEGLL
jgi:DNA repair protein RadC